MTGAGLDATEPTGLYINPRRRGRLSEGGLRCCVSSWVRTSDNAIPIRLKSGSNYQNGRLATLQAKADGYDAPIFLNGQGHVAEGSGATFFMVRRGQVVTPPLSADILESITRTTLIQDLVPRVLAQDVVEREIDRTELYVAEVAFFCGSGYEITPHPAHAAQNRQQALAACAARSVLPCRKDRGDECPVARDPDIRRRHYRT